jgi:hypothetical protein
MQIHVGWGGLFDTRRAGFLSSPLPSLGAMAVM